MKKDEATTKTDGLPCMLTTLEVAERLNISASTLSRWRARGVGPRCYWLTPTAPRYREVDVLEWLDGTSA